MAEDIEIRPRSESHPLAGPSMVLPDTVMIDACWANARRLTVATAR